MIYFTNYFLKRIGNKINGKMKLTTAMVPQILFSVLVLELYFSTIFATRFFE